MKDKRGAELFNFFFVLIALLIIIFFGVILFNQTVTGQATLTPDAYYGPINPYYENYINCVYLSEDDGWDVKMRGKVQYYDVRSGKTLIIEDGCDGPNTVTEYHCDGKYRKKRNVGCATNMKCEAGICALK